MKSRKCKYTIISTFQFQKDTDRVILHLFMLNFVPLGVSHQLTITSFPIRANSPYSFRCFDPTHHHFICDSRTLIISSWALRTNSPLPHLRFAQIHYILIGATRRTTYLLYGASRRSHHTFQNSPTSNLRFLTI